MLGLGRALGETMAVALILSGSGIITFNLISSSNPSSIAANIALQFPESTGIAVNVLIASRPRAVRHHPGGQLARALHRQPPPRVLRSELMSIDTGRAEQTRPRICSARPPRSPGPSCPAGCPGPSSSFVRCHRRATAADRLQHRAVRRRRRRAVRAGDLRDVTVVEGARKATDRVVTIMVTSAFVLAMVPLVSVVWHRDRQRPRPVRRGVLHPVDARHRRRGRRRLPRDRGHADHHGAGRAHVDPDRRARGHLPGRVRRGGGSPGRSRSSSTS